MKPLYGGCFCGRSNPSAFNLYFTKDKVVCNFKLMADELKGSPEMDFKLFEKGLQFQLQFIKKMSKQTEQPEFQPESLFNLVLK